MEQIFAEVVSDLGHAGQHSFFIGCWLEQFMDVPIAATQSLNTERVLRGMYVRE